MKYVILVSILVLAMLYTVLGLVEPVGAQQVNYVTDCTIITSSGVYVLASNITFNPSLKTECIVIIADSVVLDGNGYWIQSSGSYNKTVGIRVFEAKALRLETQGSSMSPMRL